MQMLSLNEIQKAKTYIFKNCREMEKARYNYLFDNSTKDGILFELLKYQNEDGGFGNGLEPDFLLPLSSPLATSIAFQVFEEIGYPENHSIEKAVQYLEKTFVEERKGWFAVPKEVNNYPHAVWWNWDIKTKQTVIDQSWGNPTAELLGYLYRYRKFLKKLKIDPLVDKAITYFNGKNEYKSEHEVYCFMRLYKNLDDDKASKLKQKLCEATNKLVTYDLEKWGSYTPQPIHFSDSPNFFLSETVKDGINSNLDFLIRSQNEQGVWSPNWIWHQYESEWPSSKKNWEGILTIRNLKILKNFNRIGI